MPKTRPLPKKTAKPTTVRIPIKPATVANLTQLNADVEARARELRIAQMRFVDSVRSLFTEAGIEAAEVTEVTATELVVTVTPRAQG